MKSLSKSKLLAFRQCPKRLWLEVHRPDLLADSTDTQTAYAVGHEVGDLARALYDPGNRGELLDRDALGMAGLLARTQELLQTRRPIFEAGFAAGQAGSGALALADILLPSGAGKAGGWRMVEVKSSTKVKPYHEDDVAIQHHIATASGLKLTGIALAHIDSSWVYPGNLQYAGLLTEVDLTEQAVRRRDEVVDWIAGAHDVVGKRTAPRKDMGAHCSDPYECGFMAHCQAQDEARNGRVEFPVQWLPKVQTKSLKDHLANGKVRSLEDVPDSLLNELQLRVKTATLSGKVWFDADAARTALAPHKLPAVFLDFETAQFAVPIWKGTRPYAQIPFQFSAHRLKRTGKIEHTGFLDLSGKDPSRPFAQALIAACGDSGPVFVYNATFERTRLRELSERFRTLKTPLEAIRARLVDLKPVAQAHYCHPDQHGSWSIKDILPTIAPELRYDELEGVQGGTAAQEAYAEAIDPQTTPQRRAELRVQLWKYCRLDTFASVQLWAHLGGQKGLINDVDDAPSRDMTP